MNPIDLLIAFLAILLLAVILFTPLIEAMALQGPEYNWRLYDQQILESLQALSWDLEQLANQTAYKKWRRAWDQTPWA